MDGDASGEGGGDVDPEELQRQLADIRGAMGLEERYPGQRRLWLVYGAVVAAVSLALEATFVLYSGGPGALYLGLWLGFSLVAGVAAWRLTARTASVPAPPTAPDWRVLFGSLALGFLGLYFLVGPVLIELRGAIPLAEYGPLSGALAYGLAVAMAGLGFLFAGNALRAYRIRRRDRWVFYGAGVWMLAFAAAFTRFEVMRQLGYGLFGICFLVYAVAAYVALGR